ncbi:Peptidyl-dipeptidase dcp [Pantoea agglomerans]|uniref:Peptidyl-dipeptidase dcp n=1 Tax=Enterobacter agglomerans TaxID=549 RepID=A0A379AGT2_ENTAG|nr:Peptidyl-dipeptidase dcp [Pantoea agglomerans]
MFRNYARHYQTQALMPAELHEKIVRAATFNKGYEMSELLAAALLDLHWHSLNRDSAPQSVEGFEQQALQSDNLALTAVPPRYRSKLFPAHLGRWLCSRLLRLYLDADARRRWLSVVCGTGRTDA